MAMIFILLSAALLNSAFGLKCGQLSSTVSMRPNRRHDPDGQRIVGGVEARPHSHPWIVSLQSGSHFCGGTLINVGNDDETDIVVTAAHCVPDGAPDIVAAGAHNHNLPDKYQQKVGVTVAVFHEDYNPDTTTNDIAILKLAKPVKFNEFVSPACLPTFGEYVADNQQGTVAGWGLTREGGADTSNILMQVGIPTMSSDECDGLYRPEGVTIDGDAMLCGGFKKGGKDSCQGDSGGPFVFQTSKGYTLEGVVSFGIGCARPGLPGVYARVSNYVDWIGRQVKEHSKVKKTVKINWP